MAWNSNLMILFHILVCIGCICMIQANNDIFNRNTFHRWVMLYNQFFRFRQILCSMFMCWVFVLVPSTFSFLIQLSTLMSNIILYFNYNCLFLNWKIFNCFSLNKLSYFKKVLRFHWFIKKFFVFCYKMCFGCSSIIY